MRLAHPFMRAATLACAALAASLTAGHAFAQALQPLAGDVVAAENGILELRTKAGEDVKLKLAPSTRVTQRLPASWSEIAPGSYVGTTAVPQRDGTLRAKEVHIFTEAQRGVGEGHYPMPTPGDTMTNATVSSMSGGRARDTMTNATVAAAATGDAGRRLTLTYKGGEQKIVVPDGTPIIRSKPGDVRLLVPGAHVVAYVRRDNDGAMSAERVSVGEGGFAPPI